MFDFLKSSKKSNDSDQNDSMKEMIYWEDNSRFQGVFKDFFLVYQPEKKHFSLVSMLKVDGLNVDTLPVSEQEGLNEDFGVFLSQNVLYEPQITSKNVPVEIDEFAVITACAVRWSVPDPPPDQCVHSPLISACQSLITA